MNLADKHELWGTFSVMDHVRKGAFLAEVVLYDRLVIPVPPDPDRAETEEDRVFAQAQWKRWVDNDWEPERLLSLVEILRPVAEPIEWDRRRHAEWAKQFAGYTAATHAAAADLVAKMMAGWVTGQVLLDDLPAKAAGAVAVAPFSSLDELTEQLGIRETDSLPKRMRASKGLPGGLVSAVVGRELLVPEDDDRDELDLLREAVDVVATGDYRKARRNFHTEMLRFVDAEHTDWDSIKSAVEAMDEELATLDRLTRKRERWKRADRGFFFSQIVLDIGMAALNPFALLRAGLALGQYTSSAKLGAPANPYTNGPAGALLHDARQRLEPAAPSALDRLAAKVFRRG